MEGQKMDVNEKIRQLMAERGWTAYRLARECHLSDATISNIFKRNTTPSVGTLQAICSGFNMSLAQFFAEGDLVEMTPEAKTMFEIWNKLSPNQKTALNELLNAMKK